MRSTRKTGAARDPRQDSGTFALEHPYRGRAPEIHEIVLAWLLGDDESQRTDKPEYYPLPRPA